MGTPWDMKEDNALLGLTIGKAHRADYDEPSKVSYFILYICHLLMVRLWISFLMDVVSTPIGHK